MGKLMLEKPKEEAFIKGHPDKVYYECMPEFDPVFSLSMPCRIIAVARYKFSSGFAMNGRGADTYDLLYLFDGSITIHSGPDRKVISKGEALLLRSCDSFEITQNSGPLDILILRNSGLLSSSYYEIIANRTIKPIFLKNTEIWKELIEKVIYYARFPNNLNNVLVSHVMSHIFVELYTNLCGNNRQESPLSHPKWFSETLDFIEEHYSEELTIELLASRIDMSESYFYKSFKECAGISPYQYLTKIRIDHAQSLLTTTELQIKFIARTVGYNSVNHFIRHFHRLTDMTPSEYRNQKLATGIRS